MPSEVGAVEEEIVDGATSLINPGFSTLNQDHLQNFAPTGAKANMTLADIVGMFFSFVYPLATLVLTVLLVWGGIEMMISGTTGKADTAEKGKKRIMAAIIGFLITFGSYVIMKLIEALLKIDLPGI